MAIAYIILSVLLVLLLALTGSGKLVGSASSHRIRDSLNIRGAVWKAVGAFEVATVILLTVGIWVPLMGIAGAALTVLLFAGAAVCRARAGVKQQQRGIVADLVLLVVGLTTLLLAVLR